MLKYAIVYCIVDHYMDDNNYPARYNNSTETVIENSLEECIKTIIKEECDFNFIEEYAYDYHKTRYPHNAYSTINVIKCFEIIDEINCPDILEHGDFTLLVEKRKQQIEEQNNKLEMKRKKSIEEQERKEYERLKEKYQ